jgi:predicted nucleotidyltransferase component of viral defense system
MRGLPEDISNAIECISGLNSIKEYVLIGGTALALQTGHRLSEDLDFCKWPLPGKSEIDWPRIREELLSVFNSVQPDILGFDQVNFYADNIKLSFYANHSYKSPVLNNKRFKNNLFLADIETIGVLKLEVMLRRSNFRDYYDLYSVLKEGLQIKPLVNRAVQYSNHILKTKDILNFISNGNNYKKESQFDLLKPKYQVSEIEIEKYIKQIIKKEYLN